MKIIGYQKDWFDTLIYTYGVDETLRLDRVKFQKLNDELLKEFKALNSNKYALPLSKIFDSKDSDFKNLIKDLNNWRTQTSSLNFYFDGWIYKLFYEVVGQWGLSSMCRYDNETKAFNEYKGKFNFIYDGGELIKFKADQEVIDFSNKSGIPYFCLNHEHFFPFLMIKDVDSVFDMLEVYQKVENFLLTHKDPEVTLQTNENKIVSHGFDLKKSFRNC